MTHAARRIAMACHHSWRWCQTIESSTGAEPCSGSACQSYPSMKAHAQRDVRAHVQLQVRQLAQPSTSIPIQVNWSSSSSQERAPCRAAATTSLTRRCCKMPHIIQRTRSSRACVVCTHRGQQCRPRSAPLPLHGRGCRHIFRWLTRGDMHMATRRRRVIFGFTRVIFGRPGNRM